MPANHLAQACRDAYATSKLCDIVSARIFAQRYPQAATFFSFDPGLMPGTGLARKHPRVAQWVWRNVLPRLVPILPGTTTAAKSAALLTKLLTGQLRRIRSILMKTECKGRGVVVPVVNLNRCEGKAACATACPYGVFEVRTIDKVDAIV